MVSNMERTAARFSSPSGRRSLGMVVIVSDLRGSAGR
jgi:hypothetical protein